MTEPLTKVPREFTAGETVTWEVSDANYLSSEDWSLAVYFRGPGKADVTGVGQPGGAFLATLTSQASAELSPGTYYWQAWVTKGEERHLVASGECVVRPGLSGDVGTFDGRSRAKRILDAIDAMIEGKATVDQQEYTIDTGAGARSLRRIPIPDLIQLRKTYAQIYNRELRKAGGRRPYRKILATFKGA